MTPPAPEPGRFRLADLSGLFGKRGSLKEFGILGALVLIILIFAIATGGSSLAPNNIILIVQQYSYILMLSIGMVMVIISGHIDLSVGSVAAFVGIVVAISIRDWGIPWWAGIIVGIVLGMVIGGLQGFFVAFVGVPAFIVTLAGMLIWRGANQVVGQARTVPVPSEFSTAGSGYLPEVGPYTGYNNLTLLLGAIAVAVVVWQELSQRRRRISMHADVDPLWVAITRVVLMSAIIVVAALMFGSGREGTSFPLSGIVLALFVLGYGFLTQRTTIGRHIYAVGGNRRAAELSGVRSRWSDFFVMTNMSTLAAIAGMLWVARSRASGPGDATGWELDAIAGVFIGGAAVAGGIGTVGGSIIGGLVMAVLSNGLALLAVGSDWVQVIKGSVLLLAVTFDVQNKLRGRPSLIGRMTARFERKPADSLPTG